MLFDIWLVVMIHLNNPEGGFIVEDSPQPSIKACMSREEAILTKASEVKGEDGWEISVACHLRKRQETPASAPPTNEDDSHDH